MSSYTITIAADDRDQATTTLRVEVTDRARVTELLVRAGEGDGLTARQIPAVDLDLLLRAVAPAAGGKAAVSASTAGTAGTAPADEEQVAGAATTTSPVRPSTDGPAVQHEAAQDGPTEISTDGVREHASRAATAAKRASRAAGTTVTRNRPVARKSASSAKPTASAGKATKPSRTSGADTSGQGRVYRRSPKDLATVYGQVGTAAGVADHYKVPTHTAQGWLRTLRRNQTSSARQ